MIEGKERQMVLVLGGLMIGLGLIMMGVLGRISYKEAVTMTPVHINSEISIYLTNGVGTVVPLTVPIHVDTDFTITNRPNLLSH